MNKLIFIILFISLELFSCTHFDICEKRSGELICDNIKENIKILSKRTTKTKKLIAVAQLSRKIGMLTNHDSSCIKRTLDKLTIYDSAIFNGTTFFELMAQKCRSRIYLVEVGFDEYYNMVFRDKTVSNILISDNIIKLDGKSDRIPRNSITKYKRSLNRVLPKKKNTAHINNSTSKNIDAGDKLCLKAGTGLNLREVNAKEGINKISGYVNDEDEIFIISGEKVFVKEEGGKRFQAKMVKVVKKDGEVIFGYLTINKNFIGSCR